MGAAALDAKPVRTSLAVPVAQPLDEDVQRAGAKGPKIVSQNWIPAPNAGNDRERANITDSGRDRRSAPRIPRLQVVKIIQVKNLTVEQIVNMQTVTKSNFGSRKHRWERGTRRSR